MAVIANLLVKIGADASNLTGGLGKAASAVAKFGSGAAKVAGGAAKMFGGAMIGLGTASVAAAAGAYKLAGAASDLNEAQNVVAATFGKSGTAINAWAATLASSAGIGTTSATKMVGTMGAMIKSMGSTPKTAQKMAQSLTQLSGDMASFYNLDSETAFEKLRAGIAGETEPLKQLGINMSVANLEAFALSKGIKTSYDKMDEAAKVGLRYDYIMKATADAQGDFAKTSSGLANSQRILKLSIENAGTALGTLFLPAAAKAVQGLSGVIQEMTAVLSDGFQPADVEKLGSIMAGALAKGMSAIKTYLPGIIKIVVSVFKTAISSAITILPSLLPILFQGVSDLFSGAMDAVARNAKPIAQMVTSLIQSMVYFFTSNLPLLLTIGMNILGTILQGIINFMPSLIKNMGSMVETMMNTIISNLPMIISAAVQIMLALINGLIAALPQLIAWIPTIVNTLIAIVVENLPLLLTAGIELILALVNALIAALPSLIEWLPTIVQTIVDITVENLPMLLDAAVQIIMSLVAALIENLPALATAVIAIVTAIATGLIEQVGIVLDKIPEFFSSIVTKFTEMDWKQIGIDMMNGIKNGISSMLGSVADAAKDVGSGALNGLKSLLGIKSPSKVMKLQVGVNMMRGVVDGIESYAKPIRKALAAAVPAKLPPISFNATQSTRQIQQASMQITGRTGQTNVNYTINVNGASNPDQVAGYVVQKLKLAGVVR